MAKSLYQAWLDAGKIADSPTVSPYHPGLISERLVVEPPTALVQPVFSRNMDAANSNKNKEVALPGVGEDVM